ncbi:hypothetical protein ACQKWADRAFT_289612 [Trichoderma austrokoningii]
MAQPAVFLWALDTRNLWPEAKETKQLPEVVRRALALLSPAEQASVLKYYFVKDAKLSLASSLLKRLAISRFCRVPWFSATAVRDANTKPVFITPAGDEPLLFNVTHQAGVAVLFGAYRPPPGVAIGTDIVCAGERRERDLKHLETQGWPSYIRLHSDVLSPVEVRRLEGLRIPDREQLLDYFYALWCLREAYVKMTGEALLAPWLADLEMRYYAPPGQIPPEGSNKRLEVWFQGSEVTDVDVKLDRAIGGEYMISTVVRRGEGGQGLDVPPPENLDLGETLEAAENLLQELGQ